MKPILHIVKNPNDTQAFEVIGRQAGDNACGVTVVFIQDAVSLPPVPNARTCVLFEDVQDKTISPGVKPDIELVSFEDLLNLIFSVESITVW